MVFTVRKKSSICLSASPCGCTCTEPFAAGMERSRTEGSRGGWQLCRPSGTGSGVSRSPGESRQPRLAGGAPRAAWHPPRISIFHSLAPQIDSKEVSQSNFLLLGFVVLQASNCRQPGETQRTSLSYPLSSLDTSGRKYLPQPRGPVMQPGSGAAPARGPRWPRLAPSPAARAPRTPRLSGSLFLPGPQG